MRRILENDDENSKDGTKRVVKILTRLSSASSCLLRDLVGERLGEREADLGSC